MCSNTGTDGCGFPCHQAADFLVSAEADIILLIYKCRYERTILKNPDKNVLHFTTAHSILLLRFDLNAVDYLLKPIKVERFRVAVDKCLNILQRKDSGAGILVYKGGL